MQETMKHICNTTGRSNFGQKLQELRDFLGPNNVQNMKIFVHYLICKRVVTTSQSNLNAIYIDFIRQLGIKGAVEFSVQQVIEFFKKCLIIDEEQFYKVAQRANTQINTIKITIVNLGSFCGSLTLGNNRPIWAKEIDLK
mmetsp:Transcript_9015/g.8419  ORF Transcript_9015/g.8419 Transcript_9015/m.8419 type:complete len:140 (+) Transcript_9015:166-585(+)